MCGIALVIGPGEQSSRLQTMLQKQAHRGPDHTGTFYDYGFAAIGHNRLSIIDLSASGNQPFFDRNDRYVLTFNGEIYNYKELKAELTTSYHFKTQTDTEVLLAAYIVWGEQCLDRLKGMFAFVIWDRETKTFFAARDRFGVKPLYYAFLNEETILISSEIKALHAAGIPKIPNTNVWSGYFSIGSYGAPDETFWDGVHQLKGGCYMRFRDPDSYRDVQTANIKERLSIASWFDFQDLVRKQATDLSFEDATRHYAQLLERSIKLRFRADVPVGFNLSGGLDSSTLLHLVHTYYPKDKAQCKAYTFYTGDDRYDELYWVELMLQNSTTRLEKIKLSPEEVPERARALAQSQDEPYGGIPTIAYAKLFEQARKQGTLVLLDGQGMDEQWAGYDYYHSTSQSTVQGVRTSPFKPELLQTSLREDFKKRDTPQVFEDAMQQKQYRDLFYTKLPRALRFNDRVSMASSVELREPFLDEELVAFAFAQPKAFKVQNGQTKYLVRKYVANSLAQEVVLAPKRPLQTPQREWLARPLHNFVNQEIDRLLQGDLGYLFQADAVHRIWKQYQEGDQESSFHIWQLVNASLST